MGFFFWEPNGLPTLRSLESVIPLCHPALKVHECLYVTFKSRMKDFVSVFYLRHLMSHLNEGSAGQNKCEPGGGQRLLHVI